MSNLNVIDITPIDGSSYAALDAKLSITFDAPVDPFTVAQGVSLYTKSEGLWSGPDLDVLDSKYSDVLTIGDEFTYTQLTIDIVGNTVNLTPQISLFPNKTYFLQVLPGDDITRYISQKTFGDPTYTRVATSTGVLTVNSYYSGTDDDIYTFTFSKVGASSNIDVLKGSDYIGGFTYVPGDTLAIQDIQLVFTGQFDDGDLITLDVFKPRGVTQVYKSTFTTSEYKTSSPTVSKKITSLSELPRPLRIMDSKPDDQSIDNTFCNPITIRFDRAIKPDLTNKLRIKKIDMTTGEIRFCKYYVKCTGNILKIYLTGFE